MKIIQITDVHMVPSGERLFDNDPGERLEQCVQDIMLHHADADLCVITGDLAHNGQKEAYLRLKALLAPLSMPVRLLIGNHDNRDTFRSVFEETETDANGFVQSAMDTEAGRLLFLDTHRSDSHAGLYCAQRREWLASQLQQAKEQNIYLFMHHHPFPVHFRPVDELIMDDGVSFGELLKGHDIRHMFFGHVHRPIAGSWGKIPFTTLRGLNHQTWLDFEMQQGIPCSMEPPAYAIAFIDEESVVVHSHDFLDNSAKYYYDPDLEAGQQVVRIF